MKKLSTSDRSALIRLASTLPKGDPDRRAILEGLLKVGMEHASEEAREKYLKEHQGADPKNHTVKGDKDKGGGGMDDPTSLSDDDVKQVFDAGLHDKDEWDDLIAPSLKVLEKAISEGGVSGDDIDMALDMASMAKINKTPTGKGSKQKKELASKFNAKIDALMKAGEEAKSGKKEAPKKEVKKGPAKDPGLENQDNTMSMLKDLGYDLGKESLGYSVDFTKPGALGKVIERSGIGDNPAGVKKVLDNPNLSDQDRKYVESFAKAKARKMEQAFDSEAKKKLKDIPDRYGSADSLLDEAKDPDFKPDENMDDEYKDALKAVAKDWASTSKEMKPWQDLKKSMGKKGSDRKALIRLAASMSKGSPERRTVLRMAASKYEHAIEFPRPFRLNGKKYTSVDIEVDRNSIYLSFSDSEGNVNFAEIREDLSNPQFFDAAVDDISAALGRGELPDGFSEHDFS